MFWLREWWQRRQALRLDWKDVRWLAVDLETNGLNPETDAILAVGWVSLQPPGICLRNAGYGVVKSDATINQSAIIHQLSSRDLARGEPLEKVLNRLAQQLNGAVLVAHHAAFDWRFLRRAFAEHNIEVSPLAVTDTLKLEQRRLARQKQWIKQDELSLAACRKRYHLPATKQHHALSDAVACAELFLAQAYAITGHHRTPAHRLITLGQISK